MCLTQRNEVAVPEVNGFKIFSRTKTGQLQSVFVPTFKEGLIYPSNQRIRVDTEESNFFAFGNFREAISIAREGRRKWRMVNGNLLVLPVTLYEVVAKGTYHVPSDDIQCLDGYYPAFESKEIIVHDTNETRNAFYDATLEQWLNSSRHSMSIIEKEAFTTRVPHLAAFVK